MPSRLLSLIALLCLSCTLHAQSEAPPRFQIYGGYAYLSNALNGVPGSRHALNGWVAAAGFPSWHGLRFKVDISAYRGTNLGAPEAPYFVMGGAQYTWRIGRESVFIEGLGGDGGVGKYWGPNKSFGETAAFASLLGGGLDTRLTRHTALRVNGGYQYSYFALATPVSGTPYRLPGLPTNFGHLSGGLVWQF